MAVGSLGAEKRFFFRNQLMKAARRMECFFQSKNGRE
jgi:hypothetical protein